MLYLRFTVIYYFFPSLYLSTAYYVHITHCCLEMEASASAFPTYIATYILRFALQRKEVVTSWMSIGDLMTKLKLPVHYYISLVFLPRVELQKDWLSLLGGLFEGETEGRELRSRSTPYLIQALRVGYKLDKCMSLSTEGSSATTTFGIWNPIIEALSSLLTHSKLNFESPHVHPRTL